MHPSTGSLFNLVNRAYPQNINEQIQQLLQENADDCEHCPKHSVPLFRFPASIPNEKIILNRELLLDLIWLDGKAVLHVLVNETGFQNERFIRNKTAEGQWTDFINCWASVYTDFRETICVDRERTFLYSAFKENKTQVGIDLEFSAIEANNSISQGEPYRHLLRSIFNIITDTRPNMDDKSKLRVAVKDLNDAMGPNSFVPSLFVLGVL